jgi:hypothetical protein
LTGTALIAAFEGNLGVSEGCLQPANTRLGRPTKRLWLWIRLAKTLKSVWTVAAIVAVIATLSVMHLLPLEPEWVTYEITCKIPAYFWNSDADLFEEITGIKFNKRCNRFRNGGKTKMTLIIEHRGLSEDFAACRKPGNNKPLSWVSHAQEAQYSRDWTIATNVRGHPQWSKC